MRAFFFYVVVALIYSQRGVAQPSLGLIDAMVMARNQNLELKAIRYEIPMAQGDITIANTRLNPEIQAQIFFIPTRSYWVENTGMWDGRNTQSWFQVGYPIRLQPIRKYASALASSNLSVVNESLKEAERNNAYTVANQWLILWNLKIHLDIIQKAKNKIDSLVAINENRLKNQFIVPSELIRTQILSEQYSLQMASLSQAYINESKSFRILLNVQDSIQINVLDAFVFNDSLPGVDSLLRVSKTQRPDLLALQQSIATSEKNVVLQKAYAWPMAYGAAFVNPQNAVPYIGFSGAVGVPVFNRNQGAIAKSLILKSQQETKLNFLQQQVETEVKNAYNSYALQRKNLIRFEVIMKQSQQVLNIVRYAYLKGNTTVIDFLEAQRTSLETQRLYYDALMEYRNSYIKVLYSTGLINNYGR